MERDTLDALIDRQRRQSIRSALMLVVPLVMLPAGFALAPEIIAVRPFGAPSLAWLILSPGVFPLFVLLGRWHERRAEAIEAEWIETNR